LSEQKSCETKGWLSFLQTGPEARYDFANEFRRRFSRRLSTIATGLVLGPRKSCYDLRALKLNLKKI
jgi:hypothetical protein